MQKELFLKRISELSDLKEGDKVLHLFKNKTIFSDMLKKSVGKSGKIYAINITSIENKTPLENIEFHTKEDKLNLESGSLDLILIEKTLFNIENLRSTLRDIKKYLTPKGKIIIYKEKAAFSLFNSNKQIHEFMFLAGLKLKNKFNLKNSVLEIYERE